MNYPITVPTGNRINLHFSMPHSPFHDGRFSITEIPYHRRVSVRFSHCSILHHVEEEMNSIRITPIRHTMRNCRIYLPRPTRRHTERAFPLYKDATWVAENWYMYSNGTMVVMPVKVRFDELTRNQAGETRHPSPVSRIFCEHGLKDGFSWYILWPSINHSESTKVTSRLPMEKAKSRHQSRNINLANPLHSSKYTLM